MYNLDAYKIGKMIREVRKSKGVSIEELAKRICKSTTTVYKYERDEVAPDLITTLEICNVLGIDINDLTVKDRIEVNRETSVNPFTTDTLYMYYLGFGSLAEYRLKITPENGFMKVDFLLADNQVYYTGTIESNSDIAFISLKNYYAVNQCFEKLQLTINMKFSIDSMNTGVFLALREDVNLPVIKKFILSKRKIKDEEKNEIMRRLNLTDNEKANLLKNGFWYPDISNNTGFKGV